MMTTSTAVCLVITVLGWDQNIVQHVRALQFNCTYFLLPISALPTPPRNVSVTPIPSSLTSLLVKWVEPERINGRFYAYQVVCGTVYEVSYNITWTTLEVTGLSVFTTHTCCVSVSNFFFTSTQHCANATTWLGKKLTAECLLHGKVL